MKPYLNVRLEVAPDSGDIKTEARKSVVGFGRLVNGKMTYPYQGRGIENCRGSHKNKRVKKATRRSMKRADKQITAQEDRYEED